ncbi:hypothetical protein TSO352_23195 [Azospirillum sp. TSO35-2]|nr:hypothetical protein TSO352_23195 [Azospirillum sp. TSO35-2]
MSYTKTALQAPDRYGGRRTHPRGAQCACRRTACHRFRGPPSLSGRNSMFEPSCGLPTGHHAAIRRPPLSRSRGA